jgi:hypothetical protein
MTYRQRICLFVTTFENVMNVPMVFSYFILPALLYSGQDLMVYSTLDEFRWQIRLCAIWFWCFRLNEIMLSLPTGYIHGQRMAMSNLWMSPYLAFTLIRCHFLPSRFGGKKSGFTASGSVRDCLHERNYEKRAPLYRRLKVIIVYCSVYVHLIYVLYAWGAALTDFVRAANVAKANRDSVVALRYLLVHSLMPPIWWIFLTTSFLVPVFYAIWPPTVLDREHLIERHQNTLVAKPKSKDIKQKWGTLTGIREIELALIMVYVTVLFIGTFIY